MSSSGALFDLIKLRDVSKDTLAAMTAQEVLDGTLSWAKTFDPELFPCLAGDRSYALRILSIGRGGDKPRKGPGRLERHAALSRFFL